MRCPLPKISHGFDTARKLPLTLIRNALHEELCPIGLVEKLRPLDDDRIKLRDSRGGEQRRRSDREADSSHVDDARRGRDVDDSERNASFDGCLLESHTNGVCFEVTVSLRQQYPSESLEVTKECQEGVQLMWEEEGGKGVEEATKGGKCLVKLVGKRWCWAKQPFVPKVTRKHCEAA